jgi:hypothetical protein
MAVLDSIVLDNNTRRLDVWGLKVSEQAMLVPGRGGDSVVANERLSENEDLSTIGRVGHGLRVANERSREDGFARDIGFGAEGLARKDWSILENGGE